MVFTHLQVLRVNALGKIMIIFQQLVQVFRGNLLYIHTPSLHKELEGYMNDGVISNHKCDAHMLSRSCLVSSLDQSVILHKCVALSNARLSCPNTV